MKPRGEDTAAAVRIWITDEIKGGPGSRWELGKFFFAVSSATIGTFVSIEKLSGSFSLRPFLGVALLILFFSTLVALLLAIPKRWRLTSETDLYYEYAAQTAKIYHMIWVWFVLWIAGSLVGIYATLCKA